MELDQKVQEAMDREGIYIDGTINWCVSDFQRFKTKHRYSKGKPLFVVVFGSGVAFGDWRDPSTWRTIWEKSYSELSAEQKAERKRQMDMLKYKKQMLKAHAIERSHRFITHRTNQYGATCKPDPLDHPYVLAKGFYPYLALQCRSYLVLPITDEYRNLISLQYITRHGWKQFKKHASPKGGMMFIDDGEIGARETIRICEGYATGCSIRAATQEPVVVAFSASNLMDVACLLRTKYPLNNFVICCDNDQFLKKNTGLIYGADAAKAMGSKAIHPRFDGFDLSSKPTDFNDLHQLAGIEEVRKQLV
jgi:putative DNA primase/helicase